MYKKAFRRYLGLLCASYALRKTAQLRVQNLNLGPGQRKAMLDAGLTPLYVSLYDWMLRLSAAGNPTKALLHEQNMHRILNAQPGTAYTAHTRASNWGLVQGAKWLGDKALLAIQGPYIIYKYYSAKLLLLKADKKLEEYNKHRAQVRLLAARQAQQAVKRALPASVAAGIFLGIVGSSASRPQSAPQQQPVQQQAPAQQAPVQWAQAQVPQQRIIPRYTILRALIVSPYQAGPNEGLARKRYNTDRALELYAAGRQQKQYPLYTMQQRSHRPGKYDFSTRLLNNGYTLGSS